jgi:hypothetical protein
MTTKNTKNGAYKLLVAQKDSITRIEGVITPEAIDNLENELGRAFTILKSTQFADGERYGYLATVILQDKYRIVIGNPAWTYKVPVNPGSYTAAALVAGVSAAQRKQIIAQHKERQLSYTQYLGLQEAGKELLLYGVGDDALAPLKKLYINFGDATILSMIEHLCTKIAIKMTTLQKYDYKTEGYRKPWDPTTSIMAYFTGLDKFMVSLADRGISTSVEEKTMAAGARMWESEMFTEDQIVAWENRLQADQTWENLQVYFTKKWLKRRQYSAATAKHSRFRDAALAAQEQAAAEEEGKASAMMFALLQEQHKTQLETLVASNQKAMDALLECTNALVSGTKHQDKENTAPNRNATAPTASKRPKKKCHNCGKMVYHKPELCYELEANAASRWVAWKSTKAVKTTA